MTYTLDLEEVKNSGEFSGSGMFGSVFLDGEGRAIKVSEKANSDAWLWWAYYAMTHKDCPHIPNIHSVTIDFDNNKYIAVMDTLIESDEEGDLWADLEHAWHEHADEFEIMCPYSLHHDMTIDWNWMINADGIGIINDPVAYKGWSKIIDTGQRDRLDALRKFVTDNPVDGFSFIGVE